jgi:hypothetical protein
MKMQMSQIVPIFVLSCGVLFMPARVVGQTASATPETRRLEAQQLLKDRDAAKPKAIAAEKKLREAGFKVETLGFVVARANRDREFASNSDVGEYSFYAKAARKLEEEIKDDVERGVKPALSLDIARFERLLAEVDLARMEGRLPAREE